MEPHSWIYVIATLAYLYFLSQIIDRNRTLLIRKSRIQQPDNSIKSKEKWLAEMRAWLRISGNFKKISIGLFFLIPGVEITAHLMIGEYLLHDQLLSATMFAIFFSALLLILFTMKGKSRRTPKKYATKTARMQLD